MNNNQKILYNLLLIEDISLIATCLSQIETLNAQELAELFIDTLFTKESFDSIDANKDSITYLEKTLHNPDKSQVKAMLKNCTRLGNDIVSKVHRMPNCFLIDFSKQALRLMQQHYINEDNTLSKIPRPQINMYRTFDQLDDIFQINYHEKCEENNSLERHYLHSGISVQSSYATILNFLRYLELAPNSHIIDLGSGFGRFGFVIGMMRPDLFFTGVEYIDSRVCASNEIAQKLEVESKIFFIQKDLSDTTFDFPIGDVYYMYDPFTDQTYETVLKKILQVSLLKKITVITKGNAGNKLEDAIKNLHWQPIRKFDYGNLAIFSNCQ